MNCPNCGKELEDGHMYCEDCGGEVKLVPEFEAEVEESMAASIQGILDKADMGEEQIHNEADQNQEIEVSYHKNKAITGFMLSSSFTAILIFFLTVLAVGGYTIWQNSTFFHEMLMDYHMEEGDHDKAVSYMHAIVERHPDNLSNTFRLCEMYKEIGKVEEAQKLYHKILDDNRYTLNQQVEAAGQIIQYYEQKKQYEEISAFLTSLESKEIQLAFLDYMSTTVEFSQPEGTYASLITLKLSGKGLGSIYYTTDGTVPTKDSELFQGTIFLEAGKNVISAVFINEYGVSGPVVTKTYTIESKQVSPPEVVTYSGTYNCPVLIEIERNSETTIYYTTDGTSPDRNSNLYIGNLYVPLGKSVFKFVAVDDNGKISEIVTRDFNIVLDTEVTEDIARTHLLDYMISLGGESDGQGHLIKDENSILIYEYLYPMTIEVGKDCYYFAEVLRDITTNEQHRTGRYFGVDIRTGAIYEL